MDSSISEIDTLTAKHQQAALIKQNHQQRRCGKKFKNFNTAPRPFLVSRGAWRLSFSKIFLKQLRSLGCKYDIYLLPFFFDNSFDNYFNDNFNDYPNYYFNDYSNYYFDLYFNDYFNNKSDY
jgi:hypothetical protein